MMMINQSLSLSLQLAFLFVITDQFSGPHRAISSVCVCVCVCVWVGVFGHTNALLHKHIICDAECEQ